MLCEWRFSVGLILILAAIIFISDKGFYPIDMSQLSLQTLEGLQLGLVLTVFFNYVGFEAATALVMKLKPLKFILVVLSTIFRVIFIVLFLHRSAWFSGSTTPSLNKSPLNDLANLAGVGFLGCLLQ